MADRVIVQVRFKKAIWTCPDCSQEDVEDRNVAGGDSYIHTCSSCSKEFNQSGKNMKEYNATVDYPEDEYKTKDAEDIATAKQAKFTAWKNEKAKKPVEPTKEELENMKAEREEEVVALTEQIAAKEIA